MLKSTERRQLRRTGNATNEPSAGGFWRVLRGYSRGLLALGWLLLAGYNVVVNTVIFPLGSPWGLEGRWWLPLAMAWLLLTAVLVAGDIWGERSRLTAPLVLAWLVLAGYLVVVNAWRTIDPALLRGGPIDPWLLFNLAAVGLATGLSTLIGLLSPAWWRRAMLLLAALPAGLLLATSRNLPAGLAVLALAAPAIWLGRELAAALLGEVAPLDAWVLGGAFGLGVLATLGFALGLAGLLRLWAVWPLLAAPTLALLATAAARRLRADLGAYAAWLRLPARHHPVQLVLAGIAVAYLWLSLIGALAPEIREDAVTQRLATAAYFAREGRLATDDPDLPAARSPAVGEVIYAVALAAGPLETAKLLNWLVALGGAATAFALARQLGGRPAAGVALVAFATMPIVFQLAQAALLDLFTTLLGLAAALVLVLRPRPDPRVAIAAGALLGLGIGVKEHFAYVAGGGAVTLAALALRRGGVVAAARLVGVLAAVALLVVAPGLAHSYAATGQVPILGLALSALTRAAGERPAALGDLTVFGYGRAPANLARAPFDVTLRSIIFGGLTRNGGALGYLWLALLPLLIVARPRRATLATLAGAGAAFLLWFYTAQHLRYGLPIFALLCAVGGAAYAAARRRLAGPWARTALGLLLLAPTIAGVSVQMQQRNLSYPLALGREDKETYLHKYLLCCGSYGILRLLDAQPDATRVFTPIEYARLYTRVRLSSPAFAGAPLKIEADDAEVLARLDAGGYSHIIVDRRFPVPDWDLLSVIGEGFLRRNTSFVGGNANIYLYRLLPPDQRGGQRPWARGSELLPDGGFEAAPDGAPVGWKANGSPRYDPSAGTGHNGGGAIRSTPRDGFSITVGVVPNVQYLLSHATRGVAGPGQARLHVDWQNSAGQTIGNALEVAPVSALGYHTHSMWLTAPAGATAAVVYAQALAGEVWFDDVSLRAVQADSQIIGSGNLLADPGFEGLLAGTSPAWVPYGRQDDEGSGLRPDPRGSGASVFVRRNSGFVQTVPITAGRSYRLGVTTWSGDPRAVARVQINWLDRDAKFIVKTQRVFAAGEDPVTFAAWLAAPPNAAYAVVDATAHEGGPIWLDDYVLEVANP